MKGLEKRAAGTAAAAGPAATTATTPSSAPQHLKPRRTVSAFPYFPSSSSSPLKSTSSASFSSPPPSAHLASSNNNSSTTATKQKHSNGSSAGGGSQTNFVQMWESKTRLSDRQHERLSHLAAADFLAMPSKFITTATKESHGLEAKRKQAHQQEKQKEDEERGEAVEEELEAALPEIENIQQFYSWFATIADQGKDEDMEKYSLEMKRVSGYRDRCGKVLEELDACISFLQEMEREYTDIVCTKTGQLQKDCEALVQQQKQLIQFADNLRSKLSYFDELDRLTKRFNSASLVVLDESFPPQLDRLDECIAFIKANPNFLHSELHLLKFKQLQSKGLTIVKNFVVATLKQTTLKIVQSSSKAQLAASNNDSLLYVKFRALASRLQPFCHEIEKRASTTDYYTLLRDCHTCYFQQRRQLLAPSAQENIKRLTEAHGQDLPSLIRSGCSYLLQLCHEEFLLYHRFFTTTSIGLRNLLEEFSSYLYDTARPLIIHSHNLNGLCNLTDILCTEVMQDQMKPRGESVAVFQPVVSRMVEDVQERLCYLAQMHIRDEISFYIPTPEDLNFPAKLMPFASTTARELLTTSKESVPSENEQEQKHNNNKQLSTSTYSLWYPTLERSLRCLSNLSLSVDAKIFEGLAQEVVDVCISTLTAASKLVTKDKGPIHGQLFLLRHFFILREQIAPFDINFAIMETSLDFSSIRDAFGRIMRGERSLFVWGRENALLGVVQEASPRVTHNYVDSKKALEELIVATTDSFVVGVVRTTMDPLVSFLTQATAVINVQENAASSSAPKIKLKSFANADKLKALLLATNKCLEEKLPPVLGYIHLYLENSTTANHCYTILSTLKGNIEHYLEQLQGIIRTAEFEKEGSTPPEVLQELNALDPAPLLLRLFPHASSSPPPPSSSSSSSSFSSSSSLASSLNSGTA